MIFLSTNQVIAKAQHGFQKAHSTLSNLLESLNDWTKNLDAGKDTDIAYIDFAKAFDSVSVPKLIHKLSHIGICNPLLSCIKSFLTDRSQRVLVGRSVSNYTPVISGVPQGSVLGPILFILYVNDIPNASANTDTSKLYADDVKRYALSCNFNQFQIGLTKLDAWCLNWQLSVAPAKCSVFKLNRYSSRQENNAVYHIGNQILSNITEIDDLGITIDKQLSFSNHIHGVVGKAKQRIYLLFKCFTSRNVSLLLKAYVSYVLPLFDYCSPVWSPTKLTDIDLIEDVQRGFTKRLKDMHDLPYEDRLLKCGLISLELRRLRKDLCLCYQIVNGQIALNFADFFIPDTNYKTRGNKQKLQIPKLSHVASRTNFFSVRVVPVWNALSNDIILCGSFKQFSKHIVSIDLSPFLKRDWDNVAFMGDF
jgi:ribonucleases P/MRP protein subunit RPP40